MGTFRDLRNDSESQTTKNGQGRIGEGFLHPSMDPSTKLERLGFRVQGSGFRVEISHSRLALIGGSGGVRK